MRGGTPQPSNRRRARRHERVAGPRQLAATLAVQTQLQDRQPQAIKLFCTYWDRSLRYTRIGDVVALPSKATRTVAIGRVAGPYDYHPVRGGDDRIWHRRDVQWVVSDSDWDVLDEDLRRGVNAPDTIGALNAPDVAREHLPLQSLVNWPVAMSSSGPASGVRALAAVVLSHE